MRHYTVSPARQSHRRADAAAATPADPFERPDKGHGGILGLLQNAKPAANVGTFSMLRDVEPTPTAIRPALPIGPAGVALAIMLLLFLFGR